MKVFFLAIALFGLLVSAAPDLRAQPYGPYYYSPYWDPQYQQFLNYQNYLQWEQYLAYLQQVDPYYDLHVLHYQLYLGPYQPYQIYTPCCSVSAFTPLFPGRNWVPFGARSFIPHRGTRR
jgi:hypothetical protein